MKSSSGAAVAFGRVLQAARKRSSKNQAEIANSLNPKVSVAAVSMAEGGNRPPKTEAAVRSYAAALELDGDDLLELWWAMQGMVEVEDPEEQRNVLVWWHELRIDQEAEEVWSRAEGKAKREWTPNDDYYAPKRRVFALADEICKILRRLLGDTWTVRYRAEIGLAQVPDGRRAAVVIELRTGPSDAASKEVPELLATFECPEPAARPTPPGTTAKEQLEVVGFEEFWIMKSIQKMSARDRAAVAGFIHGLREGASLFSEEKPTTT